MNHELCKRDIEKATVWRRRGIVREGTLAHRDEDIRRVNSLVPPYRKSNDKTEDKRPRMQGVA